MCRQIKEIGIEESSMSSIYAEPVKHCDFTLTISSIRLGSALLTLRSSRREAWECLTSEKFMHHVWTEIMTGSGGRS